MIAREDVQPVAQAEPAQSLGRGKAIADRHVGVVLALVDLNRRVGEVCEGGQHVRGRVDDRRLRFGLASADRSLDVHDEFVQRRIIHSLGELELSALILAATTIFHAALADGTHSAGNCAGLGRDRQYQTNEQCAHGQNLAANSAANKSSWSRMSPPTSVPRSNE